MRPKLSLLVWFLATSRGCASKARAVVRLESVSLKCAKIGERAIEESLFSSLAAGTRDNYKRKWEKWVVDEAKGETWQEEASPMVATASARGEAA